MARPLCPLAAGIALTLGQAAAVENSNLRLDSTGDLYAVCSAPASAAEYPVTRQACRAFIEGVAQYHDLISKPGKMKRLYCMPKGSTLEDGVAAFNAWAAANTGNAKRMGEEPALGRGSGTRGQVPLQGLTSANARLAATEWQHARPYRTPVWSSSPCRPQPSRLS